MKGQQQQKVSKNAEVTKAIRFAQVLWQCLFFYRLNLKKFVDASTHSSAEWLIRLSGLLCFGSKHQTQKRDFPSNGISLKNERNINSSWTPRPEKEQFLNANTGKDTWDCYQELLHNQVSQHDRVLPDWQWDKNNHFLCQDLPLNGSKCSLKWTAAQLCWWSWGRDGSSNVFSQKERTQLHSQMPARAPQWQSGHMVITGQPDA